MGGCVSWNYWERIGVGGGGGDKSKMGVKEEFKRTETFFLWTIKCEEVISGTVATIFATLRSQQTEST